MNVKAFVLAALLSFAALASNAREMLDADPSALAAKYGKPDRVQSTENDKPRPFFVTRLLEYRKAGVRIALLANDKEPPFIRWKLMGYQDIKTNNVISQDEFEQRIKAKK